MAAGLMRVEFYGFREDAGIRARVATIVRRFRADPHTRFLEADYALFCLWVLGGFKRSTLAIAVWTDKNWPMVRRGDGQWITMDTATGTVHKLTIRGNRSAGVDYRRVS